MLNPNNDRLDYGRILYAPPNYELDFAIGTTYSLDLDSLIGASIALGLSEETDTNLRENEIFLLNALRSTGDKIALFCENGRIKFPNNITKLFVLLEDMVYQVNNLNQINGNPASFHPKFWLIRYINENNEIIYRIFVLSRNLTFDKSWDVSFTMDGKKVENNLDEISDKNKNLIIFLDYLKEFSAGDKAKKIEDIIEDLKYVKFDLEDNTFEDFDFIPVGVSDAVSIKEDSLFTDNFDDFLIFTPFLSKKVISKFNQRAKDYKAYQKTINSSWENRLYLFSRKESLAKLSYGDCDEFYKNIYILKEEVISGSTATYDESPNSEESIPTEILISSDNVLESSFSSEFDVGESGISEVSISNEKVVELDNVLESSFSSEFDVGEYDIPQNSVSDSDVGGSDISQNPISNGDVAESDILESSIDNSPDVNFYQDIHAKMYFIRKGTQVDLYMGSLNASYNALNGNVEFLIHLKTNVEKFNLDMLLKDLFCGKEDGENNPFEWIDINKINQVIDPVHKEEKIDFDSIFKEIAQLNIKSEITMDNGYYKIDLNVENFLGFENNHKNSDLNIFVMPLLYDEHNQKLSEHIVFEQLSKDKLSTFFVITIQYNGETKRRIIKIETVGMPNDRNKSIISSIIKDENAFIQYLAFLFGDDSISFSLEESVPEKDIRDKNNSNKGNGDNGGEVEQDLGSTHKAIKAPILYEKMLDAVVNHQSKFEEVEYIIQTLPNEKAIPEGFKELYETFKEVVEDE